MATTDHIPVSPQTAAPPDAQFAGQRFDDVRLLQIARWFEQARPATAVPVWPR